MQKAYPQRINWENYPSEETPLNATNLNRIDAALFEIDNRVITLDTTKATVNEISELVSGIAINDETGVITVTKKDGSVVNINTNLNKVAINASYDRTTQSIILTYPDGTSDSINLSDFIQDNEFTDSPTIAVSVVENVVSAQVRANSITENHLRTNFLADIRVSEANAAASALSADADAISSRSWAVGDTQSRQGEETNNSMYFANVATGQAQLATQAMEQAQDLVDVAMAKVAGIHVHVNFEDGNLYYEEESGIGLRIEPTDGNLYYEVLTV